MTHNMKTNGSGITLLLPLPLSDRIQPNFGGRLGSLI